MGSCTFWATFIISSGIGRLQSASVKDRSLRIADAIPSSRSLTSAAFRSADSRDEIMKVAHFCRTKFQLTGDKIREVFAFTLRVIPLRRKRRTWPA